jgi:thioredoxin-related protein
MDPSERPPGSSEPTPWPRDTPTRKPNYVGILVLLLVVVVLVSQWSSMIAFFHRLIPSDNIPWKTDLQAAFAESHKTARPVLVYFTANADPGCEAMNRDVWSDVKVEKKVAASFIPVRLDADLPRSAPIARQYDVRTIPHVLILDSQGDVLAEGDAIGRDEALRLMARTALD